MAVGSRRSKDLPSDSQGPRFTAKALWPQDPIQESLICLSDEDTNRKAVAGFKGEWLQATLVPIGSALDLGTSLPSL